MNLNKFNTEILFAASTDLFAQLGITLNSNTVESLSLKDLLKQNYKDNETFRAIEKAFFIGIIDDTVFSATGMFDEKYSYEQALQQADKNYDGLMLFALQLSKHPTRTEISELTRTFNRISQKMPVALLLSYRSILASEVIISICISERFKYKQNWRQGEKTGKVIILRDIHTQTTHAGHERILLDLVKPVGVSNYAQLHEHWLKVLDVSILNKKFFQKLANWYFWAMDNVQFPDDIEKKKDIRNATNLIRLITRVIFIWFIKEKKLVPANLFHKEFLDKTIKDFNKNEKSENYYHAVLQNLFFGTLNQKMNERKFAEAHKGFVKSDQGVRNIYRFADKFLIDESEIKKLFKEIPFLNGGLFDCLDKTDEKTKKEIFVDGFTRDEKKQATVPDYLFFSEETEVDLNKYYGTKNKKYTVQGLINLLKSYKFTVTENTPIEEEIALDPELLGKVFENLLASYNSETQTTARKQTGSFYTPREIVNYMVDESLMEYLKSAVSIPADGLMKIKSTVSIFTDKEQTNIRDDVDIFFDPNNEIQIYTGNLPHWQQENVWYFVTFRLADSIPADVAEQIKSERELWLKKNPKGKDGNYSKEKLKEYYRLFSEQVEALLNAGKGSCVLRYEKTAKIVEDALLYFNNQRYVLDEWIIMPNHVHLLVKPLGEYKLQDILHSWKSFTANKINEILGKKDQLWMHESYDHIVRNEKALHAIQNYIRQNPAKAGLSIGSFLASGETRSGDASDTFENRLRNLFSYSENQNPFNKEETKLIIEAINNCKILDPACGSGAFPMGVLHKMVYILTKLDPDNSKWKAEQEEKIIGEKIKELEKDKKTIDGLSDKAVKEKARMLVDDRLKEIKKIFESENNFDDYARKLFLIENCIYGIDIQPIAVQIAKLRFFISLIIDQNVLPASSMIGNRGIRPLPNLETKFVAANTLIDLDKPQQTLLRNPQIEEKEKELKELRHKYFTTKTRREKMGLQDADKTLRKEIAKMLEDDGWNTTVAKQIVAFDPYDQNLSAPFFESEWMFGVTDGFDIVIGNPPYGSELKVEEKECLDARFKKQNSKNKNSAIYFIFVSDLLLKQNGINSFIVPKSLSYSQGWNACANFLFPYLFGFHDTGKSFENVLLEMVVFLKKKGENTSHYKTGVFDQESFIDFGFLEKEIYEKYHVLLTSQSFSEIELLKKILNSMDNVWGDYVSIERGLNWQSRANANKGRTPIYRGAQLDKYCFDTATDFISLNKFDKNEYSYQFQPKILNQLAVAHVKNPYPHFYLQAHLDLENNLVYETISCSFSKNDKVDLKFLLAINNSKIFAWLLYKFVYNNAIRSTRYDEQYAAKIPCPDFSIIDQKPFITIVDKILSAKAENPKADTSQLEKQIDEMVYKLYELTEEEIKIIENKK